MSNSIASRGGSCDVFDVFIGLLGVAGAKGLIFHESNALTIAANVWRAESIFKLLFRA